MYPTSIDGKPSAGGFRMPHQTVRVFRTGFSRSDREFEDALTPCRETSVFRRGEASHQHVTRRRLDAVDLDHANLYSRFDLDMDARMALARRIWRLVTRVLALPRPLRRGDDSVRIVQESSLPQVPDPLANLSPTRTARRAGADAKGGHDLPRHRRAPTAPDARTRNRPFRPGPPRRGPQRICSRNTGRPGSPTEHVHTVPCLTILFAHAKRKTAHEWRVSPCTWPPPRPRSRVEIP